MESGVNSLLPYANVIGRDSSVQVADQQLRIGGCPFSTYILSRHEHARAAKELSSTLAVRTRCMALIVFLQGINVGGHRRFRPSVLARELSAYDVVNVGATGTLILRKPGARPKSFAELRQKLPFEAELAFCNGSDLVRLEMERPFGPETSSPDVARFVSILSKTVRDKVSLPIAIPESGDLFVRIVAAKDRLVFGV